MVTNKYKYKINSLSKDFGMKPKDFAVYTEKAGLKDKSKMATLESEEFDALLTVLTGDNQISDMGAYLMGESYIRTEEKKPKEEKPEEEKQKAEKPKEEKPKEEAKAAEKASVATPKETPTEEKKASAPKEEKKAPKPAPAPVQKSKAEIAAEKQARFKDALQKQMELQVQKQQERQKKQQEKQQEKQSQKVFVPKTGLHNDQPMTTVTTLDEKSSRVAGTRVVDTRSSGNVDLSKYDEKLEGFVDTSKKAFAGGTQKLKKQNKNSQLEGNKGGKNGKNQNQNNQLDRFRHQQQKAKDAPKKQLEITIGDEIVVSDLASKMKRTAAEVVKKLFAMGMMVGVNATIDYDTAYLIADEFGVKVQKEVVVTIEDRLFEEEADSEESLNGT